MIHWRAIDMETSLIPCFSLFRRRFKSSGYKIIVFVNNFCIILKCTFLDLSYLSITNLIYLLLLPSENSFALCVSFRRKPSGLPPQQSRCFRKATCRGRTVSDWVLLSGPKRQGLPHEKRLPLATTHCRRRIIRPAVQESTSIHEGTRQSACWCRWKVFKITMEQVVHMSGVM